MVMSVFPCCGGTYTNVWAFSPAPYADVMQLGCMQEARLSLTV